MEDKLKFYRGKLQLNERRIAEYIEEKNSDEGFRSSIRETKYYVLKAEIELLTRFVDDLKILVESKKPIEKQLNVNGDLIGLCPVCKEMWVIKYKDYCANCGQKLDWEV